MNIWVSSVNPHTERAARPQPCYSQHASSNQASLQCYFYRLCALQLRCLVLILEHYITLYSLLYSPQTHTQLHTHLINHVMFLRFYLQSYTLHSVHFDQFLFLPHDIAWSTWSHKWFTGRLHAPNHTACIMQVSWRCGVFKLPILSALCSHHFHFLPSASWIQTLQCHRSSHSLINYS